MIASSGCGPSSDSASVPASLSCRDMRRPVSGGMPGWEVRVRIVSAARSVSVSNSAPRSIVVSWPGVSLARLLTLPPLNGLKLVRAGGLPEARLAGCLEGRNDAAGGLGRGARGVQRAADHRGRGIGLRRALALAG